MKLESHSGTWDKGDTMSEDEEEPTLSDGLRVHSIKGLVTLGELVDIAKEDLGITYDSVYLDEDDVALICRYIGERAPGSRRDEDDELVLSREGIEMMLSVALIEFPEFYERKELAQFN